ncbi:DNA (cytosine-5-)-methyltransferase [Xanthomonas nasturtii]|uniref:DNA cytosine methyltransferase n=1 Tax=Xanthomonas nasturtii TaxID=1843581 RepID=UPI0007E366D0|nr:DNA cytosine methyltransferase [Xanthomonas nasturtii]OAX89290.1 DNA (cytosine-5-)-methyltransferase [Xanthomonas nasturtii]WVL56470.1 DNA cytosine methyltransferase [Xanthomonas nasturtii]
MSTSKAKTSKRPIVIDLFAGVGGLSLGFEQAGFDVAAAVEIDPIHCAAHEYNFPYSTAICASVADLSGTEIRARAGIGERDVDVVVGGAPCQGFSMIGKRALDDPRNRLVFHYVRLISELRPKYFVFENVKGLTLGQHRRFLVEIIDALKAAGYRVEENYRVLNAADYGVPQDRRRLFLFGARAGLQMPSYPEPTHRTTVGEAISDLPNADKYKTLLNTDSVKAKYSTESGYARLLRGLEVDQSDFSYPRKFDRDLLTASARTGHTDLSRERFAATECGKTEPISRFFKLPPNGVCNTLRAGTDSARGAFTSPRPIHPVHPRVITVREAARLHSYPDWFRFHVTKWHGFRQIGNSVPPHLGRAVGSAIVKALKHNPEKPVKQIETGHESLLNFDMSEAAAHFQVARTVIAQRTRKESLANATAVPSELRP